jgi:hypothetical protein
MAELDRVPWRGGLAFVSHGVRVGIRVDDAALVDMLAACLPPRSRSVSSRVAVEHLYSVRASRAGAEKAKVPTYTLFAGPWPVVRRRSAHRVLDRLRQHLEAIVAATARDWLFVHAGVVGWRGRALLIPGRSGSGKTTLVAALVRAGAAYYSDEYAVLDHRGRVHAYPRPLRLRRPSALRTRGLTVEDLAGRPRSRPLPVGLIVVTAYRPRARWRPRELSRGEALLALLDNTVRARHPHVALPVLARAVGTARAIRSRRGDAHDVVAPLLA